MGNKHLSEEIFNKVYKYLVYRHDYFLMQIPSGKETIYRAIPIKRSNTFYKKLFLFIATTLTISLTGYGISVSFYELFGEVSVSNILLWTITYTVLFLSALGLHEYGHILASRKAGIVIEGPYFIPAPPIQLGFIGTLGAVISMKTLPPDRRSLARLGISGPLIGYLVGFLIAVIGVYLSPVMSYDVVNKLIESGRASEIGFLPLTLVLLIMIRSIPPNHTLVFHPLMFISFVVFLVTFLNLIPIGQLDGGHVVRSFMSMESYEKLTYKIITALLVIGLIYIFIARDLGFYFIFLTLILMLLKILTGRTPHLGYANQYSVLKDYRYLIIYIALLILTTPIPTT